MAYNAPVPLEPLLIGVYLDDLGVVLRCPLQYLGSSTGPDQEVIALAKAAYQRDGLPESAKQGFGLARELDSTGKPLTADVNAVHWGTELRGRAGTVGVFLVKRLMLAWPTFRAAGLKEVSKPFLRRLNGLFIHPFQHRKELHAWFHRWYTCLDGCSEKT